MKKISILVILLGLCRIMGYAQELTTDIDQPSQYDEEIVRMNEEINALKEEVADLKEKSNWFNFNFEGSSKITFGVGIWTFGQDISHYYIKKNTPITYGFDFDNKIKLSMNFGHKFFYQKVNKFDNGTEIAVKIRVKSMSPSLIKPTGSWYVMDATDDLGNAVKLYFPRYGEGNSSNILFGNWQFVLEEARARRILGTGFYINYKDVTQIGHYYGVDPMVDVLTLNHKYFNNGYILDGEKGDQYAVMYYAFDNDKYEPKSETAEAVKYWSNSMLLKNPENSKYNQKPHGFSLGYEDDITKGIYVRAEAGIASKDAFDPKYMEDQQFDLGFYILGETHLHKEGKFSFFPKASVGLAFQTETKEDLNSTWTTFSYGLTIPLQLQLPTGKKDFFKIALSSNLNTHFNLRSTAFMLSFDTGFNLLDNKLSLSFPVQYSFKNGRGGFFRVGDAKLKGFTINDDNKKVKYVKLIDQIYEPHIFNMGFTIGFDSNSLFGDLFRYQIKNKILFTVIQSRIPPTEMFFYEIVENNFLFYPSRVHKLRLYANFGLGLAKNARMIYSNSEFVYAYDPGTDTWTTIEDARSNEKWAISNVEKRLWDRRWQSATVISAETGMVLSIVKNLDFGFSYETPKFLVDSSTNAFSPNRLIGDQRNLGIFKIWTEIRF